MPSANKDRIRVTLHVDRDLYSLAKTLSKIEGKPISRLFDEAIAPLVEKYRYSPEEWENIQIERNIERQIEEKEKYERFIETECEMSESERQNLHENKLKEMQKEHEKFMKKWSETIKSMK